MNRREFLATSVIAAHSGIALGSPSSGAGDRQDTGPRILSLELLTAASLADMKDFYHRLLLLDVLEEKPDRLTIAGGRTPITFVRSEAGAGQPFYHFAFNIPENKVQSARDWQKERTPLLPIPEPLRDRKYSPDVVNYSHWNAHSVFFLDPGGNVVEYIGRHDMKNGAPGPFSNKDILYASEIAFVADDVAAMATHLKGAVGVGQYKGGDGNFMALGDEHGLLLVMKRGRVISFALKEKKAVSVYPTAVSVQGAKPGKCTLSDFPYELSVQA